MCKVYLIRKSSVRGVEFLKTAYISKTVAESVANKYKEKCTDNWFDFTLRKFDAELISNSRVIVNNYVYNLCE